MTAKDNGSVDTSYMDTAKIEEGVRLILEGIGEDSSREGLLETPERVARMYKELFCGLHQTPEHLFEKTFNERHHEMVVIKDIPLYSICEHHLVPFIGKAHIAYIPGEAGKLCGLSKLARLVDVYAKRPQIQERLTSQIADTIERELEAGGVLVVIEAEHLCMSMRGVKKPGTITSTSALRGYFETNAATRNEGLHLLGVF
jgi:GTP cyclohydrolase I